jgi:primosomal protein N' (replication factor Y)
VAAELYARVILDMVSNAVDRPFQYAVPLRLAGKIEVGSRVLVPFRSRQMAAYVVALDTEPLINNTREIIDIQDPFPVLQPEFVELSHWLSRRFFSRWIESIHLCLPPAGEKAKARHVEKVLPLFPPEIMREESARIKSKAFRQALILEHLALAGEGLPWTVLKAKTGAGRQSLVPLTKRGWVKIEAVPLEGLLWDKPRVEGTKSKKLTLTREQEAAWREIKEGFTGRQKQFLIFGVTGSGKTELYLRAAEEALKRGRTVLFLVPEIALTPQIIEQLKRRFPDSFALLHSSLSPGERYEQWLRVKRGEARVVLGARSAVFAPLSNIGLIVMDEEHENTYKQSDSPRYHTRDVARWRAAYHDAVLLMGSATPSLETFLDTRGEKAKLLTLTRRVEGHRLPDVEVVDMRREFSAGNRGIFSRSLQKAMEETLHRQEQIMLFLNRRGFAGFQLCRQCGLVLKCPSCDVSLTYHSSPEHLQCHYCGYRRAVLQFCPQCKSRYLRNFGLGTQKVEREVQNIFPGVEVVRMDSDTTAVKGAYDRIWSSFKEKRASVLIGTQMIAKGFDFPGVTLVGIVAADITLHLPDFRAGERTFQLLSQAAGRSGRGAQRGRVIIQTFTPWHYSIKAASEHNYKDFLQEELKRRKLLLYPPFSEIILINCSSLQEPKARLFAGKLKAVLAESLSILEKKETELLGPSPAPLFKIKDRFRYQLIFKGTGLQQYAGIIRDVVWKFSQETGEEIRVTVDFNPMMML